MNDILGTRVNIPAVGDRPCASDIGDTDPGRWYRRDPAHDGSAIDDDIASGRYGSRVTDIRITQCDPNADSIAEERICTEIKPFPRRRSRIGHKTKAAMKNLVFLNVIPTKIIGACRESQTTVGYSVFGSHLIAPD